MKLFDKKYRSMRHAYGGDAYIYVYEKPRPQQRNNVGGGGASTESTPNNATNTELFLADMAVKNAALAAYYRGEKPLQPYRPYVSGNDQDEKPSVLITKPKKSTVITRGLRGIDIDGTTLNATNLELTWTGSEAGSESLSSKRDKWDGILPVRAGDYKLTATVSGGTRHSVSFSVILRPTITAYTREDIELLNTFVWGDYNKSPEAILIHDLAIAAGLVDKKDDFTDTLTGKKVTDKVQAFANNARGDFNVFYSGSGDKAFIEKKVNSLFGIHLSEDTRVALVEKLEANKNPGFIDATTEFHEAMNNTLDIFFAKNSIGRTIAELEAPLSVNPTLMLMMDAAKTVVNVKLNIELGSESNGAPKLMRDEANKQLFDMVAMEVVGMAVGGVVLKVGSTAFKVIKSYFGKFKHKFSKKTKSASPKTIAANRKIATEFYKNQGIPVHKIDDHLSGTDLTKPITQTTIKKGDIVEQHQAPSAPQGNYYLPVGADASKVGISSMVKDRATGTIVAREVRKYKANKDIEALESTAKKVEDTWSIPGKNIQTEGGGIQYFTTDKSKFTKIN